jgi:hypothetical protein
VLLALLIPLTALVNADLTQTISEAIGNSFIADKMYNNNLVVLIFQDFLSGIR